MKALVTGGAGFIGSHMIDHLLASGDEVVCIDNFSLGKKENLNKALTYEKFKLYNLDLLNLEELKNIFNDEKFDTVYHLAANSDIQAGCESIDIDLRNTFLSTFNVLSCMKNHGVNEIIFASSSAIYGDLNQELSEHTGPLFPISNYGAAKLASEAYVSAFCENYDLKAWIIRFPNVVGWRLTHGVIFDLLNKLENNQKELLVLGNGKQKKPYLFIDDLINAINCIYKKTNDRVNYFNVAADSVTTVKEIVKILLQKLDFEKTKVNYTGEDRGWIGDVPKFKYDLTKVSSLNWEPAFSSNKAVTISIEKEIQYRKGKL